MNHIYNQYIYYIEIKHASAEKHTHTNIRLLTNCIGILVSTRVKITVK